MARRSGLGRGLEAILPAEPDAGAAESTASGARLQEIPIGEIRPNRYQPRAGFDDGSLEELAASIREVGVLQPILVRQSGSGFELIAGERRWRAAQRAGLEAVPALVRTVEDVDALEHALVENLQRDDLNPIEEALAYQQLLEEFGLTQEQVAARVGKSRSAVANTLRLLQLPAGIQGMVIEGVLSAGHARALLGTDDLGFQESLAERIVASALTVRDVEEAVRAHASDPSPASHGTSSPKPAALLELEELLSERLSTRVRVEVRSKRGKIEIEFADLEDLERIFRLIT